MPNYKFPSNEISDFGLTEREKFLRRKTTHDDMSWTVLALLLLWIAVLAALAVDNLYLTPERLGAPKAEAATHIDEDAYHCLSIRNAEIRVIGAAPEELAAHCLRFGVIL